MDVPSAPLISFVDLFWTDITEPNIYKRYIKWFEIRPSVKFLSLISGHFLKKMGGNCVSLSMLNQGGHTFTTLETLNSALEFYLLIGFKNFFHKLTEYTQRNILTKNSVLG